MSFQGPPVILVADDDADDRLLLRDAFEESALPVDLRMVGDGEELLDYLRHKNQYECGDAPRPNLILLDLNMPRLDGRDALKEIKADSRLRSIPVMILTTSKAKRDVEGMFEQGASAYIAKPDNYEGLLNIVKTIYAYWFRISLLPES